MSILDEFSKVELDNLVNSNPHLRGYVQGYLAEKKLEQILLEIPGVLSVEKLPDQNASKADFVVFYADPDALANPHKVTLKILVEAKSVQTNTVRPDPLNESWYGKVNIKNTDRREITLENGDKLFSTNPIRGQYDVLAVSTYAVHQHWEFVYVDSDFLPTRFHPSQPILKTTFTINPSISPGVTDNLAKILNRVYWKKLQKALENSQATA